MLPLSIIRSGDGSIVELYFFPITANSLKSENLPHISFFETFFLNTYVVQTTTKRQKNVFSCILHKRSDVVAFSHFELIEYLPNIVRFPYEIKVPARQEGISKKVEAQLRPEIIAEYKN